MSAPKKGSINEIVKAAFLAGVKAGAGYEAYEAIPPGEVDIRFDAFWYQAVYGEVMPPTWWRDRRERAMQDAHTTEARQAAEDDWRDRS